LIVQKMQIYFKVQHKIILQIRRRLKKHETLFPYCCATES